MATPIYGLTEMPASAEDRETPHNTGLTEMERLMMGAIQVDLTGAAGTYAVTAAQWKWKNLIFHSASSLTGVTVLSTQGNHGIVNNSGQSINVIRGSTTISLVNGDAGNFITDGTTDGLWRTS